jgi:hypothetical protein
MWFRTLCLMFIVGLLGACASSVNVDYDRQVDFRRLRTFALLDVPQIKTGDPRIDSPLVAKRIRTAILEILQAKGFVPEAQTPDFVVRYNIGIRQEVESDGSGISIGFGSFDHHSGIGFGYGFPAYEVESYDKAILTIDVLDGKTEQLLWRGSWGKRLYDGLTPEKLDQTIHSTVAEILARFPPGAGS